MCHCRFRFTNSSLNLAMEDSVCVMGSVTDSQCDGPAMALTCAADCVPRVGQVGPFDACRLRSAPVPESSLESSTAPLGANLAT
jgi:hypothetical protein